MRALLFVALLAGCRTEPLTTAIGDDGGGGAGGAGGADLSQPIEKQSVACGTSTCILPGALCCTGDDGASGMCASTPSFCSTGGGYRCDGPEDCGGAAPICCEVATGLGAPGEGAQCTDTNGCIRNALTFQLCHRDADCTLFMGARCCPATPQARYRRCQPTCN
jgi:hypothetical protein